MANFRFKVKTDNPGSTGSTQFSLSLWYGAAYIYNFTVYWGDSSSSIITTYNAAALTHTYAAVGTYEITINENVSGGFSMVYFNGGGDGRKITEISNLGTNRWLTHVSDVGGGFSRMHGPTLIFD
jgi:hypothetical protein